MSNEVAEWFLAVGRGLTAQFQRYELDIERYADAMCELIRLSREAKVNVDLILPVSW